MDKKKLLFYMIITMIVLLLFVDLRIGLLTSKFQRDCSQNYDVNGSCKCPHPKYSALYGSDKELNLSEMYGINFSAKD